MHNIYDLSAKVAKCVDTADLPPTDALELKQRLEHATLQHAFLKTLFDTLPDPAFLKDAEGHYVCMNKAAARWLGAKTPTDLIGMGAHDIFDKEHAEIITSEDQSIILTGKPVIEKSELRKSSDGSELWVSISKLPVPNAAGAITHIAGYRRKITESKSTEDYLRDARCILWTARVQKTGKEYKWHVTVVSSQIARMELGLRAESNDLWGGLASPEETQRMNENAILALRRNASGYENEFKIKGLDGSARHLREVVRITRITSAEWELVGVAMDVTEREQVEQELQKSLSIVSATVESTEDGVLVVNRQGEIVFLNSRFAEMWGIPEQILLSCDDSKAIDFSANLLVEPESFVKRVHEAYAQPDATFYDILKFKDGRVFERYSHPQRNKDKGEASGRVWVFRDISKRARLEEQLTAANARLIKLVKEDALTGLLNRRTVLESAELEWTRWLRSRKPFSVLMIDIDGFKKINDSFGHRTGDEALRLIADSLKANLRGLDMVGRYGGEEFIVILPETPLEGATVVAEKMLDGIRKLILMAGTERVPLTASIGVVAAMSQDKDIDGLIHRADLAMYVAKRGGKNAVVAKDDATELNSNANLIAVERK